MPVDLSALNNQITALEAEVTQTEGVVDSAIALITGFAASVQAALEADNAIDAANTATAVGVLNTVLARYTSAREKLGAAVAANPGQ